MRKRYLIPFTLSVLVLLFASDSIAQTAIQKQEGDDQDGIVSTVKAVPDVNGTTPGPGSPTGSGKPPRVGPNRQVNDVQQPFPNGLLGRSETSIAASTDGQFIVVGWNDAQGFCTPVFGGGCDPGNQNGLSGFGFSSDGGQTYTDGGAPPVVNHIFTRGDPWIERGGFDNSTFYYANLAVHDTTGDSLGVSVHRGHFTGGVFNWEDVQAFNAPHTPDDFYDKEAIATAKDGSGAGYVSVTNFIKVCGFPQAGSGQIEVWRTHDSGATWQGPAVVSPDTTAPNDPSNPDCGSTQILQQSSVPAVGPGGEVYVVWQFGPTFTSAGTSTNADIFFARSLDGGVSFSTPISVAAINSMRQDPPVGYNRDRFNDHPRVAVATSGSHKGRIYVTYYSALAPVTAAPVAVCPSPVTGLCRGQRLTSSQVFVTFSDDLGQTWSTPQGLSPAPPDTGVKRWWPVVTVEPGGNVDVAYQEGQETPVATNPFCTIRVATLTGNVALRRRGPANSLVDTFWVQSTDGGASFSTPALVSSATSNWCTAVSNIRPNFGDYIGSVSGGNRLIPVWHDGRNGVPDVFVAPILGAGKSR